LAHVIFNKRKNCKLIFLFTRLHQAKKTGHGTKVVKRREGAYQLYTG